MIGDAQAIDDHRLLVIERDGFQGINSAVKRLYVLDLSAPDDAGFVAKRLAVNLLWIDNPDGIGDGQPGGWLRARTGVRVRAGVGGDRGDPRRRTGAGGERQQLSGRQRSHPRYARRHRDDHPVRRRGADGLTTVRSAPIWPDLVTHDLDIENVGDQIALGVEKGVGIISGSRSGSW